jgi:palmitoyl-protein thioesterase
MKTFTPLIIFVALIAIYPIYCAYPVAIFHGIGDSCSNPHLDEFAKYLSANLNGVYSKCIETGGAADDWFTSFVSQAEQGCEQIKNDPNFQGDFSIVGISQGALLARYIIQSCQMKGRVKRYVSIGGPQMGVGKFPRCDNGIFCYLVNKLVYSAIYTSYVQSHIGPAGYFKNIHNYYKYLEASSFLAELNNEKSEKNDEYKQRFTLLEKVVLIKFSKDTMILPKETAWFQFYDENNVVIDLSASEFYQSDFIGVRKLNEEEKIHFVELEGNHLHFDYDDVNSFMLPALE